MVSKYLVEAINYKLTFFHYLMQNVVQGYQSLEKMDPKVNIQCALIYKTFFFPHKKKFLHW